MTQELMMRFLKLIIEWIKKQKLRSIKKNLNDWSNLITELLCSWRSPNDEFT